MFNIYCEDCIEGAKRYIEDESIDLIICDPPFGIEESSFKKHYKRKHDGLIIDGYVEAPDDYLEFSIKWLMQAKRILKPNGSIYIVSGWSKLSDILNSIKDTGFYIKNHIIWKFNFGVNTKNKFVTSHYHIIYCVKSKNSKPVFNTYCRFGPQEKGDNGESLLYKDLEDVWYINKEYTPGAKKNQNKLPDKLIEKIVLYSSNKGDKVCDFFLGNFTTATVSARLGRIPVGFEINENAYELNIKKLYDIELGEDLSKLKKVVVDKPRNSGKKISDEERKSIIDDYIKSMKKFKYKKEAINYLCEKYGRGKFSIINIINDV